MGKTVSGLEVNTKGIMRKEPTTKSERIFIEFILKSKDKKDVDIQKAIQLAEQSVYPVWQMIKNNVEVFPEYKSFPEAMMKDERAPDSSRERLLLVSVCRVNPGMVALTTDFDRYGGI